MNARMNENMKAREAYLVQFSVEFLGFSWTENKKGIRGDDRGTPS